MIFTDYRKKVAVGVLMRKMNLVFTNLMILKVELKIVFAKKNLVAGGLAISSTKIF